MNGTSATVNPFLVVRVTPHQCKKFCSSLYAMLCQSFYVQVDATRNAMVPPDADNAYRYCLSGSN